MLLYSLITILIYQKLYRIRTLISVFRSFSCILKSLEVSLLFLLLSWLICDQPICSVRLSSFTFLCYAVFRLFWGIRSLVLLSTSFSYRGKTIAQSVKLDNCYSLIYIYISVIAGILYVCFFSSPLKVELVQIMGFKSRSGDFKLFVDLINSVLALQVYMVQYAVQRSTRRIFIVAGRSVVRLEPN
uniref:G_PROTEIN_RECEP_F1_2 domain-containing protein n=1 Tax=Heterorhabditis bacteriophora TaxID=37862 RepID=A0A1I7WK64_HETBA